MICRVLLLLGALVFRRSDLVLSENSIERNECVLKGLQRGRLNDWSRSETSRRHAATL
jgi:hypothetical protein